MGQLVPNTPSCHEFFLCLIPFLNLFIIYKYISPHNIELKTKETPSASPCEKEVLVQFVDEGKDDVVIGHTIKIGTRKLVIDENNLKINTFFCEN